MVKNIILVLLIGINSCSAAVGIEARHTKKMPFIIASLGKEQTTTQEMLKTLASDLAFTGQFEVSLEHIDHLKTKHDIKNFAQKSPLLLIVEDRIGKHGLEWRLYDTRTGSMKTGKRFVKENVSVTAWGHDLADHINNALTLNQSPFCSLITYCKEDPKKAKTDICVANYNGKNEKTVASLNTFAIAPCFNADTQKPLILYSEYTAHNIRLMMTDLQGNKSPAANFDGLNMQPAFSQDGSDIVVCLSAAGNAQLYRYESGSRDKKGRYVRLTDNDGSNLSPSIMKNGDIAYCSDFENGTPQIYIMNRHGKNVRKISNGGCCTAPCYSAANQKIAYSKLIDGCSQIMVYDIKKNVTTQLTSDAGHKTESSWSPCGNYLVYSLEDSKTKRLAVHNLLTKDRTFITDGSFRYSYPCWSPRYPLLPTLS